MDYPLALITTLTMQHWITIATICALLLFSAFFSGSETALTAASRGKLHKMAGKGSRGAKRALTLTDDSESLISTVLLGNNLVNILAAALATQLFTQLLGDSGVAVATLVMTFLVLIFAEILPKTYAINNSEHAATLVSAPIRVIVIILRPFVFIAQHAVNLMLRLFGGTPVINTDATQDEIAGTIALGHKEGSVEKDDRDRLLGALDLKDRGVEEIMLHRSSIEMIDSAANPQDIIRQCLNSAHTRIPVFKGEPENIIGVLHAKDMLRSVEKLLRDGKNTDLGQFNVLDTAMKPYFVPETTTLDDQMRQFLLRKTHFALVVDEYGALQGLITLEDILEEIVGEITDEHDEGAPDTMGRDSAGDYHVDGQATIRDLNRAHDWNLPDEEAHTLAGLIIHEAQMIPNTGQVFNIHGMRFEIIERKQNRLTKIKIKT